MPSPSIPSEPAGRPTGGRTLVGLGASRWAAPLLALLTTFSFFALLELGLSLVGVRPALYDEDPYVGFSSQVPLFVERSLGDGDVEMTVAGNQPFFNRDQRFPRSKGADHFRIFCLGGSTTYGRPYHHDTSFCGWLGELLAAADPSHHWEVINAGGISYASYRVAMLMEELVRYEPDLFIIYSGHNEFLEDRSYKRFRQTPRALRALGALASRTRIYTALGRLVEALRDLGGWAGRGRTILSHRVETRLDHTPGPVDYRRDDGLRQRILEHYRLSLERMIEIARAGRARVLLVTPASNLRDSTPFKSEPDADRTASERARSSALWHESETAWRQGHLEVALEAVDEALKIDPRHAGLHYRRGRLLDARGRYPEAKAAYQQAVDEDVCPLRAPSRVAEIVAAVAASRDVPVVDFVERVADRSPQGIPGKDLFLDHVHPTIDGHRLLALELMAAMQRLGIVRPRASRGETEIRRVTAGVLSRINDLEHGRAQRNLAHVLHWAGRYSEAREAALRALAWNPHDWQTYRVLENLATRLQDDEAARRYHALAREERLAGLRRRGRTAGTR